jgi:hypothetical protein
MSSLITETRSELITKIIRTLELQTHEIAEMVSLYYDCQDLRIAHGNKKRTEPPSELVQWLDFWMHAGENVINGKLKHWVESDKCPPEAAWAYEQVGIGPVLAAGLAAHINLEKAKTPSSVWKFAGLAPGFDRKKKHVKLPYNARLKVVAWKLGESFMKVSGKENAVYGHLYADFKAEEIKRNEAGLYKEQAALELATKNITKKEAKAILESGKLTDGHLHSRAKRRAVKIFLVHYWTKGREARGLEVRGPYAETILGHDGIIPASEMESSKRNERASASESPMPSERASKKESPQTDKRANDI